MTLKQKLRAAITFEQQLPSSSDYLFAAITFEKQIPSSSKNL